MFGFNCHGDVKEMHSKFAVLFLTSMFTPLPPKSPYVQPIV